MFDFEKDPTSALIAIAIIIGLAIAIYYGVARWVFSINKQLENQERIIQLLREIADKIR